MKTNPDSAEKLAPAPVRLQRRGRLLVAVPRRKMPALAPETVEEARTRLVEERAQRG
ncbi:MAG: hypothetical protein ACRD6I_15925 [Candidatus Acidiferrales bacterium]